MNDFPKNLLVLASAGSGKTYTLSDRIINLIAKGAKPSEIVALTFTRKAAGEFADAILEKLADRAERGEGDSLRNLGALVDHLPELTLGTMDGFFAKIVRGFQYELGISGGKFDLLEGEAADTAYEEILDSLITRQFDEETEAGFVRTFQRATKGKEDTKIADRLAKFVEIWHDHYLSSNSLKWGPAELARVDVGDWEMQKDQLIDQIRRDWPNSVEITDKRQEKVLEPMLSALSNHRIGSGSLDRCSGLLPKVMEALPDGSGGIEIGYYKPFTISGLAGESLRKLVNLAARCEFASALARTRGINEVIAAYDEFVERELRQAGKLGFDDVKRLMGRWMSNEDARLRREAIDFRLDARHHHWLLDEFQDTSRAEWNGLQPLVDEAITGEDSSAFVVGDKKQAIFAWRGGEIGLFDEIEDRYRGGLEVSTMAESWRSCPEVLEAVNGIFGDRTTMATLFGGAENLWDWEEHVSAAPLQTEGKAGYAQVEMVDADEKFQCVIDTLREIGVGKRDLTCGILVNTNEQVGTWADLLRSEGFQVVEEGARKPSKDHPVGVLIWQLFRWLADPADHFAREAVFMSPLGPLLKERFGDAWQAIWEQLGGMASNYGFAEMLDAIISPLRPAWSEFGKRRAADLQQSLVDLDNEGVTSISEAADRLERMKISQSPGQAAVQVMTTHKSKGLGFDVVVLPAIPNAKIPDFTHYQIAQGEGWISDAPAQWVRKLIPELVEAEQSWTSQQTYEAFCKLYVALTRAKRGLYVFLDQPSKSHDFQKPSLQNWITMTLGIESEVGNGKAFGKRDWFQEIPIAPPSSPRSEVRLGTAMPKRGRTTPSGQKKSEQGVGGGSIEGRLFGSAVHQAFEKILWLDVDPIPRFDDKVRATMDEALGEPAIQNLLSENSRNIALFREQPVEAVINGNWMSGIIDRLHVVFSAEGKAEEVELIDFKTDAVQDEESLKDRYNDQMAAYVEALALIYPEARIKAFLVSTSLPAVVVCGDNLR